MRDTESERVKNAARYYMEAMTSFLYVSSEDGVNNFIIKGSPVNLPVKFNTLVGLFSRPGINLSPEMPIINLEPDTLGMVGWHHKILELQIPQRVIDLKTPIDPEVELQFKSVLDSAKLPFAVLSVGKVKDEEVVMLSYLWGADPEKVLETFKSKSRERLRSIN